MSPQDIVRAVCLFLSMVFSCREVDASTLATTLEAHEPWWVGDGDESTDISEP